MSGFAVILAIALLLPEHEPVIINENMASIAECNAAVREMTFRAPRELRAGGQLSVSCVVIVPKSENP